MCAHMGSGMCRYLKAYINVYSDRGLQFQIEALEAVLFFDTAILASGLPSSRRSDPFGLPVTTYPPRTLDSVGAFF